MRSEIAKRIKEAKEEGDLSENAAFDRARDAQALNEGRVEEIKNMLEKAVIITENKTGVIGVGSHIKVESKEHGVRHFDIVGPSESNPVEGFISNESPLGKAFISHKKGETVTVKTPKGMAEYKITEVK